MASLPGFRFDISGASGSQGLLSPKDGWRAYVLPRGAYAAQDSTGTVITFDSAAVASRFAVGNWIQAGLSTAKIRQVGAVGGNSISVSGSALTVAQNDRIFLFGNTEPTVSGGSATYTTPNTVIRQRDDDAATAYSNSMITTNANGLAQGFAVTNLYDVLIQDGNRANQGSLVDLPIGIPEGISVSDSALFGNSVTIQGGLGVTGTVIFRRGPGEIRYADSPVFTTGSSTGGIQEALNDLGTAGGKVILSGGKTYSLSVEVAYSVSAKAPIVIQGGGWTTTLSLTGVSNKGLSMTGVSGSTGPGVILRDFKMISNTSGTSPAGIHMSGLAVVNFHDIYVLGNSKITNGIQFTAAQQGEISGGFVQTCGTGILLEGSGGVRSNGIDIHAVSLDNNGKNIDVTGADDTMIHHNHLTRAPIGIDFSDAGAAGLHSVAFNHIENHTTAGVRVTQGHAEVLFNSFYTGTSGTDMTFTGGNNHLVMGNLINGGVSFGSAVSNPKLLFNRFTSTAGLSDTSTLLTKIGNDGTGGPPSNTFGISFQDSMSLTSRAAAAGDMAVFNPNAAVGGAWGIRVAGAGAGADIYCKLGTNALVSSTSNDAVRVMSAVAGTTWAKFNANGVHGQVVVTASLPVAGVAQDGLLLVEDAGAGDRNLIIYGGGQRFRIDGGVAF